MDEKQLSEIEARVEHVVAGPWKAVPTDMENGDRVYHVHSPALDPEDLWIELDWPDKQPMAAATANFVAGAREDVPALVAEVRRLRLGMDAAMEEINTWRMNQGREGRAIDAVTTLRAAVRAMLDAGVSGQLATIASRALTETSGLVED